jgi:mitochondrial fission protein ELM1
MWNEHPKIHSHHNKLIAYIVGSSTAQWAWDQELRKTIAHVHQPTMSKSLSILTTVFSRND